MFLWTLPVCRLFHDAQGQSFLATCVRTVRRYLALESVRTMLEEPEQEQLAARLHRLFLYLHPCKDTLEMAPAPLTYPEARKQSAFPEPAHTAPAEVAQFQPWLWSVCVEDADAWVVNLVVLLIEGSFVRDPETFAPWHALTELCLALPSFSRFLLPYVLHAKVVTSTGKRVRHRLAAPFNAALAQLLPTSSQNAPVAAPQALPPNTRAVEGLLEVVGHLRRISCWQPVDRRAKRAKQASGTHWDQLDWLDFDYFTVARASLWIGDDMAALYYVEVALEKTVLQPALAAGPCDMTMSTLKLPAAVRDLLCAAFARLGEQDSLQAFMDELEPQSRLSLYRQQKRFADIIALRDWMQVGTREEGRGGLAPCAALDVASALQAMGQMHVASLLLAGMEGAEVAEVRARAAWQLRDWSLPEASRGDVLGLTRDQVDFCGASAFQRSLYHGMEALAVGDGRAFARVVSAAKAGLAAEFQSARLSSPQVVVGPLARLQCLLELGEVASVLRELGWGQVAPGGAGGHSLQGLLSVWASRGTGEEYEAGDLIRSLRASALQLVASQVGRQAPGGRLVCDRTGSC